MRGNGAEMEGQPKNMKDQACATQDLVEGRLAILLWGIPLALIIGGGFLEKGRVWLWVPALVVAGVACLVNAVRCGRLHCYFTGVLYLLGTAAAILRGIGFLSISWNWLFAGLAAGTVLACVPEWMRGKYTESKQRPYEGNGAGR